MARPHSSRRCWSPVEAEQLHALWAARDDNDNPSYSRAEIARRMGLSERSIVGRLGREFKAGTLKQRRPHVSVQRGAKAVTLARARTASPAAPRLPRRQPPRSGPIPPPRSCQWPLWGNGEAPRPPTYCDEPIVPSHPYCHDHCKLAFTRSTCG